jgi:diadenosine tetraphosphate (Ap4A) HIT family hydrolase
MPCELCDQKGGQLLWQGEHCRVVYVDAPGYPGFCRVIWKRHVREMTDLSVEDRMHFMQVVFAVEAVLRGELEPHKINLASFGNAVPHLHWHVIPRYTDDPHFPQPAWGEPLRPLETSRTHPDVPALAAALAAALQ